MPPGVATAPTPSVRTSVGSIADRSTARQRSAATAFASPSVTDVNAFSQSPGCYSAAPGSVAGRLDSRGAAMVLVYVSSERTGVAVTPQPSHEVVRVSQITYGHTLYNKCLRGG